MADQHTKRHGDELLFRFYLMTLVFLPLPLGCNRPWAWNIMAMLVSALVSIWLLKYISGRIEKLSPAIRVSRVPLAFLIVWAIYPLLQFAPIPASLVKAISSGSYELYSYGSHKGGETLIPISVERGASLIEFIKQSSYVMIFFLTIALVNTRQRLKTMATTLMYTGLFISVYGLFNTLTGYEYIWWNPKEFYLGFVTGTFISRNHFAGHLELVIPIGIGLALATRERFSHYASFKARVEGFVSFIMERQGRRILYILIMVCALLLTASRAGNAALLIALGAVIFFAFLVRGAEAREVKIAPYIFTMLILAGLWMGLGALPERYETSGESVQVRLSAWSNSMNIIKDYPIFGSGAGTFKYMITLYEDGSLLKYYDHAHNDYIELLADQGVVGFTLIGTPLILIFLSMAGAFKRRRDPLMRGMLFAALTGFISLMLHAIVDFNFHIPANAAYFFAIMGIGIAAGTIKREKRSSANDAVVSGSDISTHE